MPTRACSVSGRRSSRRFAFLLAANSTACNACISDTDMVFGFKVEGFDMSNWKQHIPLDGFGQCTITTHIVDGVGLIVLFVIICCVCKCLGSTFCGEDGVCFRRYQSGQRTVFSGAHIITVLQCVYALLLLQLCGRSGPTRTHGSSVFTAKPRV